MKNAILAGVLCSAVILPVAVSAETATSEESLENKFVPMETMTITYRSPLDYALHQYTVELMGEFRMEISTSIYYQAKRSSRDMYKDFAARHDTDLPEIAALTETNNIAPK